MYYSTRLHTELYVLHVILFPYMKYRTFTGRSVSQLDSFLPSNFVACLSRPVSYIFFFPVFVHCFQPHYPWPSRPSPFSLFYCLLTSVHVRVIKVFVLCALWIFRIPGSPYICTTFPFVFLSNSFLFSIHQILFLKIFFSLV